MNEIKYLVHPVSPEEKAKVRAEGFKILDARFAPVEQVEPIKPKKRKSKKPQ